MKIIVINGYPAAGKDSFCTFANIGNPNYVYSFSTIDVIKILATNIGWNGEKDNKGRRLLSDLKDALTRYNDYPYNRVKWEIEKICRTNEDKEEKLIFFVHSREPEDIKHWVKDCNAKTLFIRRPMNEEPMYSNHADAYVEDYHYDYYIDNDGSLNDLYKKATDFMEKLNQENWSSTYNKEGK